MATDNVFHRVKINQNLEFVAHIDFGGPYLNRIERGVDRVGDVALGRCALIAESTARGVDGWHICNWQSFEPHVKLTDLSNDQIKMISDEFGIQIEGQPQRLDFFGSKAWESLKEWVQKNPLIAKRIGETGSFYVGDWYHRSIIENQSELSKPTSQVRVSKSYVGDEKVKEAEAFLRRADAEVNEREIVRIVKEALKISPLCVEAHIALAELSQFGSSKAISNWRRAVGAGEKYLGTEYFKTEVGDFWGLAETRPYMRAKQGLAMSLLYAHKRREALDHMRDMIRLNPRDNQGIRFHLAPALLVGGYADELKKLLEQYSSDGHVMWALNIALAEFDRNDPAADESLMKALSLNPHVVPYLVGEEEHPFVLDHESYLPGSIQEARNYAAIAGYAWDGTPNAANWVAKIRNEMLDQLNLNGRSGPTS